MAVNPKQASAVFTKLQPLFNRILVKRHDAPKHSMGGIVLPEPAKEVRRGTVVAVGPGGVCHNGVKVPLSIQAGDNVLLPDYGGTKIEYEGIQYFLFRESEILAKLYD